MEAFQQIDAAQRKAGLRKAFDEVVGAPSAEGDEPTVDLNGLLAALRSIGLLHEYCAAQVEAFVRKEFAADVRLSYTPDVADAYDKIVSFEHGHGLPVEEHRKRFPMANAVAEQDTGKSVLLCAVEEGDLTRIEKLLLLGADPNCVAIDGTSPQYLACKMGNAGVVRALSFCGADPHAEINAMGETPFHVACHRGHTACVDELCLSGADPNRQQRDGSTPLHSAVRVGRLDVVKLLLCNSACVPPPKRV